MTSRSRPTEVSDCGNLGLRWVSWPLVISCLAMAIAGWGSSRLLVDPDVLWHIRLGEWIWEHRSVPSTDIFSHTMHGSKWVSHEWLASLVIYLLFDTFSWSGPVASAAICFGLANGLLARYLFKHLEPARALLIMFLVIGSLANHLLARPHVFAMPILAAWVIQIVDAADQGQRPPLWMAALMLLWANLHGSFVFGLGFAGLFALEAIIAAEKPKRTQLTRQWSAFIGCAVLASLINPHHVNALLFPFQLKQMSYTLSVIAEWMPPNFQRFQFLEIWILGMLLVAMTLKIKISWARLTLLVLLIHLALSHSRHLTLLAIISPLMLARPLAQAFGARNQTSNAVDAWFDRLRGVARPMIAIPAFISAFALAAVANPKPIVPPESIMPKAALQFLASHPQSGQVLNSYGLGGVLIYQGIPVFVDGRADLYGDKFLKNYVDTMASSADKLEEMMNTYEISWVFINPKSPAAHLLDLMPQWERLYADEHVVIHRKKPLAIQNSGRGNGSAPSPRTLN